MLSDIAAWFITMAVLNPVQAEVQTRLDQVNASAQTATQVQQCITTHTPRLIERAGNDPSWAIKTAIGVSVGWTSPATLLDATDPNCAALAALLQSGEQESEQS